MPPSLGSEARRAEGEAAGRTSRKRTPSDNLEFGGDVHSFGEFKIVNRAPFSSTPTVTWCRDRGDIRDDRRDGLRLCHVRYQRRDLRQHHSRLGSSNPGGSRPSTTGKTTPEKTGVPISAVMCGLRCALVVGRLRSSAPMAGVKTIPTLPQNEEKPPMARGRIGGFSALLEVHVKAARSSPPTGRRCRLLRRIQDQSENQPGTVRSRCPAGSAPLSVRRWRHRLVCRLFGCHP